jgi:sugar phosphate isomerase/epimerase
MQRRDFLKAIPAAGAAMAASAAAPKTASGRSPRLRTAICAYSFRKALGAGTLRYEDLVDMAVKNDVDGLDLTVYWFPKDDLDGFLSGLRLKAYLNAVEIPSIAIRTDLCRKGEREQDQEVAWLMHWVDAADRLGASFIRVFGGNVPKDATEDEAAGWVTKILKRSADYAGSKGVILGLENHGGITLKAERIQKILDAVNHPFVRMNLDTGNFRSMPYEQIEQSVPYAANTQFKVEITNDGKREESDWDRIVKMLAEGGYRGYMALEYEAEEDPFTAVPRHLKTLNELKAKYGA